MQVQLTQAALEQARQVCLSACSNFDFNFTLLPREKAPRF